MERARKNGNEFYSTINDNERERTRTRCAEVLRQAADAGAGPGGFDEGRLG